MVDEQENLKLQNDEVEIIKASKQTHQTNLAVFETCKAFFERNTGVKTKVIRNTLLNEMDVVLQKEEPSVRSRLKRVAIIANKFLGFGLNHTDLYFNRIEEISNLLQSISENKNIEKDSFQKARSTIQLNLKLRNKSKKRFNEDISNLIQNLRELYDVENDLTEFQELSNKVMELSEDKWKRLVQARKMRLND